MQSESKGYAVERRGDSLFLYTPDGSKIKEIRAFSHNKEKARALYQIVDILNKVMK